MKNEKLDAHERVAEIEKSLSNYSWMINEIKRLQPLLKEDENKDVAQFDVRSILPKPQSMTSNPISNEMLRSDRIYQRLINLEERVLFIQDRMHVIVNERERAILNCMLDGMSLSDIARHMGISNTHTHRIRRGIAQAIANIDHAPINAG